MKRNDKIILLKAIQSKKLMVADLQPRELEIHPFAEEGVAHFFINKKRVDQDVFGEALKKEPGYHNHTIKFIVSND